MNIEKEPLGEKGEGILRIQEEGLEMDEVLRDLRVEIGGRFIAYGRGSMESGEEAEWLARDKWRTDFFMEIKRKEELLVKSIANRFAKREAV